MKKIAIVALVVVVLYFLFRKKAAAPTSVPFGSGTLSLTPVNTGPVYNASDLSNLSGGLTLAV
jgi:hypothetical protein